MTMTAMSPMSHGLRRVAPEQRRQAIRIVTYNILADKYSGNHTYCPQQYLNWDYRQALLLKQLESYAPDLLCLQEVQEDVYHEVLLPWMQTHGYSSLYHRRPKAAGSKTVGPLDGVSLHFRDSMFTLEAEQAIHFSDHALQLLPSTCCCHHQPQQVALAQQRQHQPRRTGRRSPPQQRQQQQQQPLQQQQQYDFMKAVLQRQDGAVMALLRHMPSQQQLVACSTHLHWNPNFPDIKVAQAAILCKGISSFIELQQQRVEQQGHRQGRQQQQKSAQVALQQQGGRRAQHSSALRFPVVVGGDFNALWRKYASDVWDQKVPSSEGVMSGVYQLMSAGQVGPDHRDHPANRLLCRGCSTTHQENAEQLLGHTFTSSGLQLESSHFGLHGREPTLTTRTSSFSGCLDYIWLSKQHWQVQSTLEMPYQEPVGEPGPPDQVTTLGTCPNAVQPSDHLAVGCDAVLMPAEAFTAAATAVAPQTRSIPGRVTTANSN